MRLFWLESTGEGERGYSTSWMQSPFSVALRLPDNVDNRWGGCPYLDALGSRPALETI
jgi:hypothetical protein